MLLQGTSECTETQEKTVQEHINGSFILCLCVLDPVLWSTLCNSHILTADRFNGQLLEPGLRSWRFVTRPTSNIACRTMRTAVDEVITTHGLLKKLNVHLLLNPKHNSASWLVVFSGWFTCGRGQQAHPPSLVLQHVLPSGQAAVSLQGTSEAEYKEGNDRNHSVIIYVHIYKTCMYGYLQMCTYSLVVHQAM